MLDLHFSDLQKLTRVRFENCQALFETDPLLGPINTDSRNLEPGAIFWALHGERFDGHAFVNDAFERGAVAAVVDKNVGGTHPLILVPDTLTALQELAVLKRERFKKPVIAITGSNGKTTTKEMIAHLLAAKWKVHKTEGNLNNHIGLPLTLLQLKAWHQVAVVELGSNHPGEIERLAEIAKPDWALITNIGPAHLGNFDSLQAIAKEKLSLFQSLPEGKLIFVNANDPFLTDYRRAGLKRVSYGFDVPANIQGKIIAVDENGCCSFRFNETIEIKLNVPGVHNAYNALAAAAVALFSGLTKEQIKERLENYSAFDKRMQMLRIKGVRVINDAYNANPQSMKAAFETLKKMKIKSGLFLALGDMLELGAKSLAMHEDVLRLALELEPKAVFVLGKNMRLAAQKIKDARIGIFTDHRSLARAVKERIKAEDVLFIKGSRGAQMEKILTYL